MMSTYGGYLLYMTVLALLITIRYWMTKKKVDRENQQHKDELAVIPGAGEASPAVQH